MPLGRIQTQIVDRLHREGLLEAEQRAQLVESPKEISGEALEQMLEADLKVPPFRIQVAKALAMGMHPVNGSRLQTVQTTFERLTQDFCKKERIFPAGQVAGHLLVAFARPVDSTLMAKLREIAGMPVVPLLVREADIASRFTEAPASKPEIEFGDVVSQIGAEFAEADTTEITAEDIVSEESAPIITLANNIIEDAYFTGASDIHVEPQEKHLLVRYRIDGVCVEKLRLPRAVAAALVTRMKIMCNMDIAERRLPQDGRIVFKQYSKRNVDFDLRVSTAPLNYGEGVVLRILDKQKTTLPMPALGFSEENLARYRECIRQPYGMILHCGPTGSGKSMTLYSALNEINTPDLVIRTAEDPIEYTLAGINQMQMNRQIGLTFANALRAFLRQDPDIILVGEIRDKETAQIAVEAALTGHMLLSTLHTNDAPSAVTRLIDMGIESFLLSSSLICICAQRLMRRLCKNCRREAEPLPREEEILRLGLGWSGRIYKPSARGCPRCGNTGYKGRVGIHELMTMSTELVEAIVRGAESTEIKRIAMRHGMKTLHQDSLLKVREGITSLEEALATVPIDLELASGGSGVGAAAPKAAPMVAVAGA